MVYYAMRRTSVLSWRTIRFASRWQVSTSSRPLRQRDYFLAFEAILVLTTT